MYIFYMYMYVKVCKRILVDIYMCAYMCMFVYMYICIREVQRCIRSKFCKRTFGQWNKWHKYSEKIYDIFKEIHGWSIYFYTYARPIFKIKSDLCASKKRWWAPPGHLNRDEQQSQEGTVSMYLHKFVCVRVCLLLCRVCLCLRLFLCMCMCTCMCVCMCVCLRVYVCVSVLKMRAKQCKRSKYRIV